MKNNIHKIMHTFWMTTLFMASTVQCEWYKFWQKSPQINKSMQTKQYLAEAKQISKKIIEIQTQRPSYNDVFFSSDTEYCVKQIRASDDFYWKRVWPRVDELIKLEEKILNNIKDFPIIDMPIDDLNRLDKIAVGHKIRKEIDRLKHLKTESKKKEQFIEDWYNNFGESRPAGYDLE